MQKGITLWMLCGWLLLTGARAQTAPGSGSARFEQLLRQGFTWHRQARFDQAMPLFRQALALRPNDYFASLLLGIDELRTGQAERAVKRLRAAQAARPGEAMASGYLGEAYAALGRYDEAAVTLQRAAAEDRGDAQGALTLTEFYLDRFAALSRELRSTRRGLAFAYLLQAEAQPPGQAAAARAALDHAVRLAPGLPGLLPARARLEIASGQWSAAEADEAAALRLHPVDLDAWAGQAQVALHRQQVRPAVELLNRVARHSPWRLAQAVAGWPEGLAVPLLPATQPSPAQILFDCVAHPAQVNCRVPELAARITALAGRSANRAMRSEPLQLQFNQQRWEMVARQPALPATATKDLWRGIALAHLDRCAEAIPLLERSRSEASLRPEADYRLARCDAAEAGAVAARRLAGHAGLLHEIRGDIDLRLARDGARAEAEYRQALATGAGDPGLWSRMAEAELAEGKGDAAAADAHRALQLDPNRVSAARTLAELALKERDYGGAIPWLQRIAQRDPDDMEARVQLGTAWARQGDAARARGLLQQALAAGYPDERGALHFLLGTVLRKLGQAQAAAQAFRQAQQLSDTFSRAGDSGHAPTP